MDNMIKYLTQSALAKKYGLTSRKMGTYLKELGLKDGPDASDKAIDEGYTSELLVSAYGEYYKWNEQAVRELLYVEYELSYISGSDKEAFEKQQRIKKFWKGAAADIRVGAPDDMYLGLVNIADVSHLDIARELSNMSYFRNKILSYELIRGLDKACKLHAEYTKDKDEKYSYSEEDRAELSEVCEDLFDLTLEEVLAQDTSSLFV